MTAVWVLEDDGFQRKLYKELFGKGLPNCTVREFENPKILIDALRKEPHPDLIITDASLRDADGVDAAHSIRTICKTLPILMVSGMMPEGEQWRDLVRNLKTDGIEYFDKEKFFKNPSQLLALAMQLISPDKKSTRLR